MSIKQQQVKGISDELLTALNLDKDSLVKLLSADNYLSFSELKKNGSKRWIDAPRKDLKRAQTNIMYNLLYKISPHKCAYGFVVGKSPAAGAKQHLNNKLVLMLDLHDYFPTINYGQIISAFYYILKFLNDKEGKQFNIKEDSKILTALCSYHNVLPQGAPTSPALANIITKPMDDDLSTIADKNQITYTRYADDLAFSHEKLDFNMDEFLAKVKVIIKTNGFTLNNKKTRVLRPHRRQSITGVVINDKLGVAKKYYKNTRAGVYNFNKNLQTYTNKQIQKLRGRIEWIRSIDPAKGQKLLDEFENTLKNKGKRKSGCKKRNENFQPCVSR